MKCTIIIFAVLLASCSTPKALSPTITNSITPTTFSPQPTTTFIPTVIPTLSFEQEQAYSELSELLSTNGGCSLPCWWGLTPGISSFQEAQEKLQPLSIIAEFYFPGDKGGIYISYPVNDLFLYLSVEYSEILGNLLKKDTIGVLTVSSDMYDYIDLEDGDIDRRNIYDAEAYKKIFNDYTLSMILFKYGPPNDVFVRGEVYGDYPKPDQLFLTTLYSDYGIFITYEMLGEIIDDNLIGCPEDSFITLRLLPEDLGVKSQEILLANDVNWEGNFSNIQSLEDATQLEVEDFYQTFREPSGTCLQTPSEEWLIQ